MTDNTLSHYDTYRIRKIADEGVQVNDGYDYLVPSSKIVRYNEALRSAADKIEYLEIVTDDMIERGARAMFEAGGVEEGDWAWADVVREEPDRAELWRNDARQVINAILGEDAK